MNKKNVWYACYGSNLLKERFMLYIKGGDCRFNGKHYDGCTDKNEPSSDKPISIQYELYFGNSSGRWENGGVAFLKPDKNEKVNTLGRMYLITEEQFLEIQKQEGPGWYNKVLELSTFDDIPVNTFTHSEEFAKKAPCKKYIGVVMEGLKETYPKMTHEKLESYLKIHE